MKHIFKFLFIVLMITLITGRLWLGLIIYTGTIIYERLLKIIKNK